MGNPKKSSKKVTISPVRSAHSKNDAFEHGRSIAISVKDDKPPSEGSKEVPDYVNQTADEVAKALVFYENNAAKRVFLGGIDSILDGVLFTKVEKIYDALGVGTLHGPGPKSIGKRLHYSFVELEKGGQDYREWPKFTNGAYVEEGVYSVPLSGTKIVRERTHKVEFSIGQVRQDAGTIEVYADGSIGVDAKFLNVIKFSEKGGYKISEKRVKKRDVKISKSISETFRVQKLARYTVVFSGKLRKTHREDGFQVVKQGSNDLLGPFWPIYRLNGTPNAGFAHFFMEKALKMAEQATMWDFADEYLKYKVGSRASGLDEFFSDYDNR